MSTPYNGNAANATGTTVTITQPDDGDALTAGSSNVGSSRLADWAQRLADIALNIATTAWTFTQQIVFQNGVVISAPTTTDREGLVVTGSGIERGVFATGGSADGTAVRAIGGGTNGWGLDASAAGTGTAIYGEATGSGNAAQIDASTGTGTALDVIGNASAPAATLAGGAGQPAALLANGTAATGGTRQDAATLTNGDLNLSGVAAPTSTTAITNRLTPGHLLKAWACVDLTNADPFVPTVDAGVNIASVSRQANGYNLRVTFAAAMASVNYYVSAIFIGNAGAGTGYQMVPVTADGVGGISAAGRATTYVDLLLIDAAGTLVDLDSKAGIGGATVKVLVEVVGLQ